MAKKKYKNMKIEQEELKPIAVGAFESRKRTSIGTFIILTFFFLVVIFLPQISDIVNEYLNPEDTDLVVENPSSQTDDPEEEEPYENVNETFYTYTDNFSITDREEITVSNILVDATTNTLSYTITNNTNSYLDVEGLNYYIEIYNGDRTLLERIKLASPGYLAGGAYEEYTQEISEVSATTIGYIVLVQKTTDDYPEVDTISSGSATMVCTNDHETITYYFLDNALQSMTSVVTYLLTDDNYQEIYETYQALATTYNITNGISSVFITNTDGFNVTTNVDLEDASRTYIFNADSFTLDTEPKVVSFEMEAQGFVCD